MLLVIDAESRLRALDWEDHEPRMQRLLARLNGRDTIRLLERAVRPLRGAPFKPISMAR